MPYYAYFCNSCGHEGTRYHNVSKCHKCGNEWNRNPGAILLESYPNIMPDLMGHAVREALDSLREARGAAMYLRTVLTNMTQDEQMEEIYKRYRWLRMEDE